MEEYYWISSSINEDGSWEDYPMTSSVDESERDVINPPIDESTNQYILLDSYKELLESNLHKELLSEEELNRLTPILSTQRYVEGDREFIQSCINTLVPLPPL